MDAKAIESVLTDIIRVGSEELPTLLARLYGAGLHTGLEILAVEDAFRRAQGALQSAESTLLAVLSAHETAREVSP